MIDNDISSITVVLWLMFECVL